MKTKNLFMLSFSVLISTHVFAGLQVNCVSPEGETLQYSTSESHRRSQISFGRYQFHAVHTKQDAKTSELHITSFYQGDEKPINYLPHGSISFTLPSGLVSEQSFELSVKHKHALGRQPYETDLIQMQCKVQ